MVVGSGRGSGHCLKWRHPPGSGTPSASRRPRPRGVDHGPANEQSFGQEVALHMLRSSGAASHLEDGRRQATDRVTG